MSVRIIVADVLDGLARLEPESVHCVVTSPPYWGLRDYGTGRWEGGDPACDHSAGLPSSRRGRDSGLRSPRRTGTDAPRYCPTCPTCGAVRADRQIGLEASPELYVARMVEVFLAVSRVLRRDGTLWLNLGDCYAAIKGQNGNSKARATAVERGYHQSGGTVSLATRPQDRPIAGLKPKDLVGIPWRVAFALQAAGWWLRSDIVWSKPNPMPESVTDRPTKAHEYLFLMARSERYYYDREAISEAVTDSTIERISQATFDQQTGGPKDGINPNRSQRRALVNLKGRAMSPQIDFALSRNRRSVWEIPTSPFPEAHFATFPPALVEPCILAGTSERGACPDCGAPWRRLVDVEYENRVGGNSNGVRKGEIPVERRVMASGERADRVATTTGWAPGCDHGREPVPCLVLDPFAGAGTTGLVADRLGRSFVGIELNPEYASLAERRLRADCPLFCDPILTRSDP